MAEAALVGPESQSEGGPVGPPPPGITDAPAISHNPVAAVFAHPGAVHDPLIRVASKIGSMVTSPGVIHAARTVLGGIQAVGQGALEGMHPQIGANAAKADQGQQKIGQNQELIDLKNKQFAEKTANDKAAQDVKDRLATIKEKGTPDEKAFAGYLDKNNGDAVAAFQEQQADKRKPGAPTAGHVELNRGIPISVMDDQGKRWDPKDPNLPADLKAHVDTAQGAYDKSTSDALTNRLEGMKVLVAPKWAQVALAQAKNAGEIYQPARDADQRYERMTQDARDALNGNQQSMVSLLTNHIGMTLGAQKGARITKDMLHEAAASAPWIESIEAKWGDDGYLSGVTLTPGQITQMLDLARSQREVIHTSVEAKAQQERGLTKVPASETTAKPSGELKNARAPKSGDVVRGYKFNGGDPNRKENWVKQ